MALSRESRILIRVLDIFLALFGLFFGLPVLAVLLFFGFLDTGSPLFFQKRIGRNIQPFTLIKFRTMSPKTKSVASHMLDPDSITKFGVFLRRTKLDELPQLWNVLKGDMSLVGPRPCLFSQIELKEERKRLNVFSVRPGITGLSQLSGVDMSTPGLLAKTDAKMISNLSLTNYFKYIFLTILGKGSGDAVQK